MAPVMGTCLGLIVSVSTAAVVAAGMQAPVPPTRDDASAAAAVQVTAIGCVMRSTPTGPVAGAPDGDVTLTRATVLRDDQVPAAARQPTEAGTATPPSPPPAPGADNRAFVLVADATFDLAALVEHMGRRVEVTGRLEDEAALAAQKPESPGSEAAERPEPETAHPSAPVERLRVAAFRPVSGVCF